MTHDDEPRLNCFPLTGSMIFFTDSEARTTFYDTEAHCMITTPSLHVPKHSPIALAVPSPGSGGEQDGGDRSLYIMDTWLDPRKTTPFEALIRRKRPDDHFDVEKTWHCDTLPLLPFFHHPRGKSTSILSYAVVGNVICISTDGSGTYCFDTVSRTWSLAGDWQMPFSGKASASHQLTCAADLSSVLRGHEPKQRYVWGDPDLPEEWIPSLYSSANIVSLGAGRFCITKFFEDMKGSSSWMDGHSDPVGEPIVVFTGL